MAIVRQAIEADYSAMAGLIKEFFDEHTFEIKLDIDYSIKLAKKLAEEHIMLVLEIDNKIVGGIGGIRTPFLFNSRAKLFQEIFFYVKDGFRKHSQLLLAELEKVCRQLGLGSIIMAHPDDGNLDKMERFYKARGYKTLETHFIRRLNI